MNRTRGTIGAAAIAGLMIATINATAVEGASVRTEPTRGDRAAAGKAVLSGDIRGLDSSNNADIAAYLHPTPSALTNAKIGETLPLWELPADAVTLSGDAYSVSLDPASVPEAYVEGDLVDFLVQVTDVDARTHATTAATLRAVVDPETGRPAWVDALTQKPEVSSSLGRRSRAMNNASQQRRSLPPHAASAALEHVQMRPIVDSGPEAKVSGASSADMSATAAGGTTKLAESNRMVTIATSYPIGGDWARMKYSGTNSTRVGVAFQGPDGWYAEGTRSRSHSSEHKWPEWTDGRSYQVQIKYGKYHFCSYKYGLCNTYWEPMHHTLGNDFNIVKRPNWWGCTRVGPGQFSMASSGGESYKYGAAVKFRSMIGIDLYGEREWLTSNDVTYNLPVRRRICGNGRDPGVSDKVMARYIP